MSPSRGDILSAASLLLAILAVLYSLWYSDIASALRIAVPRHREDAAAERRQVGDALRTRALPLGIAAALLVLVFLPEAIHISTLWVSRASDHGLWNAIRDYDPVSLSLVLVVIAMLALAAYTAWLARQLWALRQKLTPPETAE